MENDKKVQIIKAAQKRLAKHGLQKTTLEEIARDLRIGKATIYHYFRSKEEIFYETVNFEVSILIADIREIFSDSALAKKQKVITYLSYKETALNKFPILAQVFNYLYSGSINEKDMETIHKLIAEEEKLITDLLLTSEIGTDTAKTASAVAAQSWGNCLIKKISPFAETDMQNLYEVLAGIFS